MPEPAVPLHQIATASDLVRHFGYWQDRAARAPVYVLHRGRPRLVLTSVEIMHALCEPHALTHSERTSGLAAILARIEDRVIVADDNRRILAASAAARSAFGALAEHGRALTALVAEASQPLFAASIDRALRTGTSATLTLPAGLNARESLTLSIDTWPGGLLLVAREATDLSTHAEALAEAIAVTDNTAVVRLDTRGRLQAASATLAGLRGAPADALAGTAFAALFAKSSQKAVDDTLERVLTSASPLQVNALLCAGQTSRTVRIGLAPCRAGNTVGGIIALLIAPPG